MATSQINARIDTDIKSAGDAALAEAGYTPTQAIRILWEFAGRNRGNASALRKGLRALEGKSGKSATDAEAKRRLQIANEGPAIVADALRTMGIEPDAFVDETPYDDLLEEAMMEKLAERGLDR